jgi:hypothetical protein
MDDNPARTTSIQPGTSLGDFCKSPPSSIGACVINRCVDLGACLFEVLSIVKRRKEQYAEIDLYYDRSRPVQSPVAVSLPKNGVRLRFDGPDQRLRLIEVMEFAKIGLTYKGSELVKDHGLSGPAFKRIYQIFGASYPGEYFPPPQGQLSGKYVLSWSGIAFDFPLQHNAWSPEKDHVSLLGSTASSPATAMALFEGTSWPEVRNDMFTRVPTAPRLHASPQSNMPPEIEKANMTGDGTIELIRRAPATTVIIKLRETTMQDLITELGRPEAEHRRNANNDIIIPGPTDRQRTGSMTNGRPHPGSLPSSYSSTGTDTFDADFDSGDADEDPTDRGRDIFWCYFSQGLDILIGPPPDNADAGATSSLVVLKVFLHGNVPGSYAFNRHRRLRWTLNFPSHPFLEQDSLNSESNFDEDLRPALMRVFKGVWPEAEMGRGRVVNRTWGSGGGGMSDSTFFLPDAEKELVEGSGSEQWLGNTKLYAFPGFGFEVLENGAVAVLAVS